MKTTSVKIIISILFVCFLSCKNNKEKQIDNKSINLISLTSNYKGNSIKLSEFVTQEQYIQLETNENCLIGHINKIISYEDLIFVLDSYFAKKLFVFDTDGNHLYNISKRGNGPGEYNDIFDFIIHDNKIYILNDRSSVIEYTLDAKYIQTYQLPFWANRFFKINGKRWGLLTNSDKSHGFEFNYYLTANNFTAEKGFIKSRFDDFSVNPFQQTSCLNDTNYFFLPFDHRIHYASENGIGIKYEFKFPKNCILIDSEITKYAKLPLREGVNQILDNTVFLSSIIFTQNLKIISFSKNRQKFTCFINGKDKNTIIPKKNIINDVEKTSILPTFYTAFESNKIIACYQSHELIEVMDEGEKINTDLKKHISDSKENANPIIVIYSTIKN